MSHNWPICTACDRRITVHILRGHIAYCDEIGGSRGAFTIKQVATLKRVLGHPLSDQILDLERREQNET